jgi:histidyl-tRNA synthetase
VAPYQAPRGTYDLLPEEAAVRREIVARAQNLLEVAGFGQIETPVFEETELFARTVGEATDIVRKEMYTFTDRSDRSLTLRPEGTAPVCRAYIEHGMHKLPQPVKLWYVGPMFRYEAPQAGRFRQHNQVGAEVIGSDDPAVDAELIYLLSELYSGLGLDGVRLRLSSIGSPETRAAYEDELRSYLLGTHVFDSDQQARIEVNPLRAFDWDGDEVRAVTDEAPKMLDRLDDENRQHFDELRALLDAAKIEYEIDTRLVRGLDYYTRTLFEIQTSGAEIGSQNALLGGGRYDGMVKELGGPDIPAIGFALGLERVLLALPTEPPAPVARCFIAPLGERAQTEALLIARELREAGIAAEPDTRGGSLKSLLRRADASGSRLCLVLGDSELERSLVTVKDLSARSQIEVARVDLVARARELLASALPAGSTEA